MMPNPREEAGLAARGRNEPNPNSLDEPTANVWKPFSAAAFRPAKEWTR
ncbi:MAG: hypothetical protein ACHQ51_03610 [Elusimicrobiota bacterium]